MPVIIKTVRVSISTFIFKLLFVCHIRYADTILNHSGCNAVKTACHLVECCSASAFAVATLEEGITLRRAFDQKFPEMGAGRVRILV